MSPRRETLPDDHAIADALVAGDEEMFDGLYRAFAPVLRSFTRGIIRDVDLAEDITHDVLIELWERPDRFDPSRGTLLSWLRTIARRRAVDRIRTIEASRARDFLIGSRDTRRDDARIDAVETLFERSLLKNALTELSEKQREAVLLRYFHDLSGPEVAALLQVPVGTAKTRARDGLLALHALLPPRAA